MQKSCKNSRGHTMEKISCEKMEMIPLTAARMNHTLIKQNVTYPKRI